MRKEIDDKSSSLKSTGEEIVDLRNNIKILKKSNDITKKRSYAED